MAFDSILAGEDMNAQNIQQIIDCLNGVSGAGQVISLTQVSDASNYALDVRNLDTSNGYGLRVRDASDNVLIIAYKNVLQLGASPANDALAINCNISGKVYMGDSANANMTVGLTINQGANDDQVLAFKSSDVSQGMSTMVEVDTFGAGAKASATAGGLRFDGYSEDNIGLMIVGNISNDDGTRSTAGVGAVILEGGKKSGTTIGAQDADKNVVVVRNNGTTRFILDSDGDSHQDVGTAWTNFDTHDDLALLNLLSAHITRKDDPLRQGFGKWLEQSKAPLETARIVSFNEDGHHFVNMSRLQMLTVGAIRQLGERLALTEQRLAALPQGA